MYSAWMKQYVVYIGGEPSATTSSDRACRKMCSSRAAAQLGGSGRNREQAGGRETALLQDDTPVHPASAFVSPLFHLNSSEHFPRFISVYSSRF